MLILKCMVVLSCQFQLLFKYLSDSFSVGTANHDNIDRLVLFGHNSKKENHPVLFFS